mgnify:CR=1 FL=1
MTNTTEFQTELAAIQSIPLDAVSVKATTTEKLGFLGREEGIAAHRADAAVGETLHRVADLARVVLEHRHGHPEPEDLPRVEQMAEAHVVGGQRHPVQVLLGDVRRELRDPALHAPQVLRPAHDALAGVHGILDAHHAHPSHAGHSRHALHHLHAVPHGLHVIDHQCLALLSGLRGGHLVAHFSHGPHALVLHGHRGRGRSGIR